MLILNRMIHPFEVRTCKVSGEMIIYGDYFYHDEVDGLIVKATVYKEMQRKAREDKFDYTLLNQAQNEKEYRELVKKAEKDYFASTILDREVFDNGNTQQDGVGR